MTEFSHPSDNCTVGSTELYRFYLSVMIVEFIVALPLNLSVIYIFIFKLKFWKSKSNNIFLFNLVLADILLLICLLIRTDTFWRGERRSGNSVMCSVVLFLLFLNRGASITFLTVVSIDRYLSVVHSGLKNTLKIRQRSVIISVLIWALLLVLTTPAMLKTFDCCDSNEDGSDIEDSTVTVVFRELVFFIQVLIPLPILIYCTTRITLKLREKTVGDRTKLQRAVFLVICVVLVFSICFVPSAISRTVLLVMRAKEFPTGEEITVQVYDGMMCLSYLNCLLDPIVYCLSSTKFKKLYIATYLSFLLKKEHHANHEI
ncbi:hydroxycarboxylic acid receptor 2 [Brachyhypopomus gauderio]|uniref:hydroxycarboxylic acid receptor 2 n=1 Tax=Brachyhypopomus gauderio TaxID=698409 RepID=UPI00404107DE